jgi:hypothetical protein
MLPKLAVLRRRSVRTRSRTRAGRRFRSDHVRAPEAQRCSASSPRPQVASLAVPLPCHSQQSWPVPIGQPRTTPERPGPARFAFFAGDGSARSGFASRGSIGRGLHQPGPRWGRDRAVNDRNAADNHRQPQPSSVQLSSPARPSTAGHGHPSIRSDTEGVTGSNPVAPTT